MAFVIIRDEYESIGTHWTAFYVEASNDATYFESFGVEQFAKEIKKFIGKRNITRNIFRIQAYDSIVRG